MDLHYFLRLDSDPDGHWNVDVDLLESGQKLPTRKEK
jgi:hypothetical protein